MWLHKYNHKAVLTLSQITISSAHLPSRTIELKKSFFIPTFHKRKTNCKFKPICGFYSDSSYTCTHTGGNYCGSYRKLSAKPSKSKSRNDGYLVEMPQ